MAPAHTFQVDLHGLVDLLSRHLYSSPRVYLRELLQNAVDAITARHLHDPQAPARVAFSTASGRLTVEDSGIGLRPEQVDELLATIGRSSKRDDLGFDRGEFIGQFGIGLLSAFMVADRIEIVTRAADGPTTRWVGQSDGRYTRETVDDRPEIGTTVTLQARPGADSWFDPATVRELVTWFGALLPVTITVDGTPVGDGLLPWGDHGGPDARRARLVAWAQDVLGFTPFDVIDLEVPAAGLAGVAFVVPYAANPTERPAHRVFLKRMLLSESVTGLVPDWAFFVRCLVDVSDLRPTASREALYDDDRLVDVREAIGSRVRGWVVDLATSHPRRLQDFLRIHQLGVKALAVHDDDLLDLVDRWVQFDTTFGPMSLAEFRDRHGALRYVPSVEGFRQVSGVASAQGLPLINAGYVYDTALIDRLGDRHGVPAESFDPSALTTSFEPLPESVARAAEPLLASAREVLAPLGCDVVIREFDPASLPSLFLIDRSAAFEADRRAARAQADGLWSGVLDALDEGAGSGRAPSRPTLVLNLRHAAVRRLLAATDAGVRRLGVEGLYGQALLQGHHPVGPTEAAVINRSFLGLLDLALLPPASPSEPEIDREP